MPVGEREAAATPSRICIARVRWITSRSMPVQPGYATMRISTRSRPARVGGTAAAPRCSLVNGLDCHAYVAQAGFRYHQQWPTASGPWVRATKSSLPGAGPGSGPSPLGSRPKPRGRLLCWGRGLDCRSQSEAASSSSSRSARAAAGVRRRASSFDHCCGPSVSRSSNACRDAIQAGLRSPR